MPGGSHNWFTGGLLVLFERSRKQQLPFAQSSVLGHQQAGCQHGSTLPASSFSSLGGGERGGACVFSLRLQET